MLIQKKNFQRRKKEKKERKRKKRKKDLILCTF